VADRRPLLLVAAAAGLPACAWAHAPQACEAAASAGWTFDPLVVGALVLSGTLYAAGLHRLWRSAGRGRGVRRVQAAAFLGGWLVLAAALVSPIDALGSMLFSVHMVQHELLMVVAAPLLAASRPLAVWTWALPRAWRPWAGRCTKSLPVASLWRLVRYAPAAWALHALALWAWHVPAFFEAALASTAVHTLQHLSFFLSALLFWWAPIGRASRAGAGAAVLYLFTTMVHTGALGALLTLSPTLWYPWYAGCTAALGLEPLEDQQIGGLIMWIPAGLAYLAAALAILARALRGASWDPAMGRPGAT
jgi:putative membrane protein